MRLARRLQCLLPIALFACAIAEVRPARRTTAPAPEARPPAVQPAPAQAADYKTFERKPTVLSEDELNRLRTAVLARCNLGPASSTANAPWYFHYELGLELERRGDAQRALDSFLAAAERKARPGHMSRMYGMWFTDYLPYLEIAKAHAALGNWTCAASALAASERAEEVRQEDPAYTEFLELKSEVQAQAHRRP